MAQKYWKLLFTKGREPAIHGTNLLVEELESVPAQLPCG